MVNCVLFIMVTNKCPQLFVEEKPSWCHVLFCSFTLFFKMLGINIITWIASQHMYQYKIQL